MRSLSPSFVHSFVHSYKVSFFGTFAIFRARHFIKVIAIFLPIGASFLYRSRLRRSFSICKIPTTVCKLIIFRFVLYARAHAIVSVFIKIAYGLCLPYIHSDCPLCARAFRYFARKHEQANNERAKRANEREGEGGRERESL